LFNPNNSQNRGSKQERGEGHLNIENGIVQEYEDDNRNESESKHSYAVSS